MFLYSSKFRQKPVKGVAHFIHVLPLNDQGRDEPQHVALGAVYEKTLLPHGSHEGGSVLFEPEAQEKPPAPDLAAP